MYEPSETRYETMPYNRCGKSGLRLPALSVGLWQNFGVNNDYDTMKEIILTAFDHGVTHFDLANNYGPEPGRAEINFGRIFKENLRPYRDQLIISTKAGYVMWDGPYGNWVRCLQSYAIIPVTPLAASDHCFHNDRIPWLCIFL